MDAGVTIVHLILLILVNINAALLIRNSREMKAMLDWQSQAKTGKEVPISQNGSSSKDSGLS